MPLCIKACFWLMEALWVHIHKGMFQDVSANYTTLIKKHWHQCTVCWSWNSDVIVNFVHIWSEEYAWLTGVSYYFLWLHDLSWGDNVRENTWSYGSISELKGFNADCNNVSCSGCSVLSRESEDKLIPLLSTSDSCSGVSSVDSCIYMVKRLAGMWCIKLNIM